MSANPKTYPTTIAEQIDAAWEEYESQQKVPDILPSDGPSPEDSSDTSDALFDDEDNRDPVLTGEASRFEVTGIGPCRLYPNGTESHTSKRRLFCKPKKSDIGKVHDKLKGRSYSQIRQAGQPATVEESIENHWIPVFFAEEQN